MSRVNRELRTVLDLNGPYLRIDTQPPSLTTWDHQEDVSITVEASVFFLTGDEADIGDLNEREEDAVPAEDVAESTGTLLYEWMEVTSDGMIPLSDGGDISGTKTKTLRIKNIQSPEDHYRKFHCHVDYEPSQETGNIINPPIVTDDAEIHVRPYIFFPRQPVDIVTNVNQNALIDFEAQLSDNRFPWQDIRLEYQWYGINSDNTGLVPNTQLFDSTDSLNYTADLTEELATNQNKIVYINESATGGVTRTVGIPTESTLVEFTMAGGGGGNGGNEGLTGIGGEGGVGRNVKYKFTESEIEKINNSLNNLSPHYLGKLREYKITGGGRGSDGATGVTGPSNVAKAGLGDDNDGQVSHGGDGGHAGPDGVSGAGGAGGGSSSVWSVDDEKWLAISGGAGGGGGGSYNSPGGDGEDGNFVETITHSNVNYETQEATVVNFNPKFASTVEYGFYVKTESPIDKLTTGETIRVAIIWDKVTEVYADRTVQYDNILGKHYITNGNVRYYANAHRASELGWCNSETDKNSCTRGNGQYVNAFDIFRQDTGNNSSLVNAVRGSTGTDKTFGDGGGGGGAGGGSVIASTGGSPGADATNSQSVPVTFYVEGDTNLSAGAYIEIRKVILDGFNDPIKSVSDTSPSSNYVVTHKFTKSDIGQSVTVNLETSTVYDVVTDVEDSRTSDNLRILDTRRIGYDDRDNDRYDDIVIKCGDGTFDYTSRTVELEDGSTLGKTIVRYTSPARFENITSSTGGKSGRSAYDDEYLTRIAAGSGGLSGGKDGYTKVDIKTEQPYERLDTTTKQVEVIRYFSRNGTQSDSMTVKTDAVTSKRYRCLVSAVGGVITTTKENSQEEYTNIVEFVSENKTDTFITVESIAKNNFAFVHGMDLQNSDLVLTNSLSEAGKKIDYHVFYSNDPVNDVEVDIKLFGSKGKDYQSNSGGEGGFSYIRLNMKPNTEYVVTGLDETINTPFLYKKSTLLASVGSGGDAGPFGDGGDGGGIGISGQNGKGPQGGIGASRLVDISENGIFGSASILSPISPDSKATENAGGVVSRCSKGSFYSSLSPCEDVPVGNKFRLSDGTEVTNTSDSITRGFKAGYNIHVTSGSGTIVGENTEVSRGGNGAAGGNGGQNGGGGGGTGYLLPNANSDVFLRSEENNGTRLGGSTGDARVEISLAEVPSFSTYESGIISLQTFRDVPDDPTTTVLDQTVTDVGVFQPLPVLKAPSTVAPKTPSMAITSPSFGVDTIKIREGQTHTIEVQTENIPGNVEYFWKIFYTSNAPHFTDDDFVATTGSFFTNGNGAGSFTIQPKADVSTDFIHGRQKYGVRIYSNNTYNQDSLIEWTDPNVFEILDTSLDLPTLRVSSLQDDSNIIKNIVNEGDSITITIDTENIPALVNGVEQQLYWEVGGTEGSDFAVHSGYIPIDSNFNVDSFNVPTSLTTSSNLINSHRGTASFTLDAIEDFNTEGNKLRWIKVYYNGELLDDTQSYSGRLYENETRKKRTLKLQDTSKTPEATITNPITSIDERSQHQYEIDTLYRRTGDILYWAIYNGNGTSSSQLASTNDFVSVTGSTTVSAPNYNNEPIGSSNKHGTCSFVIYTRDDFITEGSESYTLRLYLDANRTVELTNDAFIVNDTSETPFATIVGHSINGGSTQTGALTTIDEGEEVVYTIDTFYAYNGEKINWKLVNQSNGQPVDSADYQNEKISGSETVTIIDPINNKDHGFIQVKIHPKRDELTEASANFDGTDHVRLVLEYSRPDDDGNAQTVEFTQAKNLLNFDFDVIDTSRTRPTVTLSWDPSDTGFDEDPDDEPSTQMGERKTITLTTTDIPNGTVLNWEVVHTGVGDFRSSPEDFWDIDNDQPYSSGSNVSGQVTVSGAGTYGTEDGTASFDLAVYGDLLSENESEYFKILIKGSGFIFDRDYTNVQIPGGAQSFVIEDTSEAPFIVADKDEYSVLEGDDVTINLTSGYMTTQVYWRFKSTTPDNDGDFESFGIYTDQTNNGYSATQITSTYPERSHSFTMSAIKDYRTENSNSGGANQDVREDQSYDIEIYYYDINGVMKVMDTVTVKVLDASLTPMANFTSTSISANELDGSVTIDFEARHLYPPYGYSNRNRVYWTLHKVSGNSLVSASSDFTATSGDVAFTRNTDDPNKPYATVTKSITLNMVEDYLTEGTETFRLRLWQDSSHTLGFGYGNDSATITLGDDSKTPSASFNSPPSSISERSTVLDGNYASTSHTFNLLVEHRRPGIHSLYWKLFTASQNGNGSYSTSSTLASNDFDSTSGTISVDARSGYSYPHAQAAITLSLKADKTTEPNEFFTLCVYQDSNYNTKLTQHSFKVKDQSRTPRTFSVDSLSNMNETDAKTQTVTVRGYNVSNDLNFKFSYNGRNKIRVLKKVGNEYHNTDTSLDFTSEYYDITLEPDGVAADAITNKWKGTATIEAVGDLQNDGNQTYKVEFGYLMKGRWYHWPTTTHSNDFTVEDTSLIVHRWSPNDGVAVLASTPDASSVTASNAYYELQEGNNYSFKFQSTKPKNTTFSWSLTDISGGIRSNDFLATSGTFNLSADGPGFYNNGYFTVKPLDDGLADSDKTAKLTVYLDNSEVGSLNLKIINVTERKSNGTYYYVIGEDETNFDWSEYFGVEDHSTISIFAVRSSAGQDGEDGYYNNFFSRMKLGGKGGDSWMYGMHKAPLREYLKYAVNDTSKMEKGDYTFSTGSFDAHNTYSETQWEAEKTRSFLPQPSDTSIIKWKTSIATGATGLDGSNGSIGRAHNFYSRRLRDHGYPDIYPNGPYGDLSSDPMDWRYFDKWVEEMFDGDYEFTKLTASDTYTDYRYFNSSSDTIGRRGGLQGISFWGILGRREFNKTTGYRGLNPCSHGYNCGFGGADKWAYYEYGAGGYPQYGDTINIGSSEADKRYIYHRDAIQITALTYAPDYIRSLGDGSTSHKGFQWRGNYIQQVYAPWPNSTRDHYKNTGSGNSPWSWQGRLGMNGGGGAGGFEIYRTNSDVPATFGRGATDGERGHGINDTNTDDVLTLRADGERAIRLPGGVNGNAGMGRFGAGGGGGGSGASGPRVAPSWPEEGPNGEYIYSSGQYYGFGDDYYNGPKGPYRLEDPQNPGHRAKWPPHDLGTQTITIASEARWKDDDIYDTNHSNVTSGYKSFDTTYRSFKFTYSTDHWPEEYYKQIDGAYVIYNDSYMTLPTGIFPGDGINKQGGKGGKGSNPLTIIRIDVNHP